MYRQVLLHGGLAGLLVLAACGGGGGASDVPAPPADPALYSNPVVYAFGADAALPAAEEGGADTEHSLQVDGATLVYRARAGHLTARHSAAGGAPQASMFHVAYTLKDGAPDRPLIFFYNGGPGSASVWLHLGGFGPKRVVTRNPGTDIPQPFSLVDNPETLLPLADLVFVDAVGTGFSQALAPRRNADFWGVDADAQVFRDFVLRYLEKHQRQAAPVVLFGESYGGLRSPLLAAGLLSAGARLRAVVLQSAILDYNSNCAVLETPRVSCAAFVPSYGATAAWFQRARPQPADARRVDTFVQDVANYADQQYAPAAQRFLTQGQGLPAAMNQQLADYSGLSAAAWQAAPLLGPEAYRRALLPQRLLGRYDSRVEAATGDPLAQDGDPSSTVIVAPFRNALASHLQQTLKYRGAVAYQLANNAAIQQWRWQHDGQALPDAIPDLGLALTLRPSLKLLVLGGYHDLATPFRLTEQDLARLQPPPPGLVMKRYVGGHMTYLDDQVRPAMRADLIALLRQLEP